MCCDVNGLGVVVACDSQPVVIGEGRVDVVVGTDRLTEKRILIRRGVDFDGLTGWVGTDRIGPITAREALERFGEYCPQLAAHLSDLWKSEDVHTGLWIFVAGCSRGEPQFWYVNNIHGDMNSDNAYTGITQEFKAVYDLNDNLIPGYARAGEPRQSVLARMTIQLRNGALRTTVPILDDFNVVMEHLYGAQYPEFGPFQSVEAYATVVRMRLEFVKRLHEREKGLYRGHAPTPIDGTVHVLAAATGGEIWRIPLKADPQIVPRP